MNFKTVIFVLLCVIFQGVDSSASILNDSIKASARTSASAPGSFEVKKANVVYPSLLAGHESQSIEYVERFSTAKRGYLLRTFSRGKRYFPKVAAIFKKYQLPQELKVLIALESAFNANAVSSAGAVGYWQIMDNVAKEYGLKIQENQTSVKTQPVVKSTKKPVVVDDRKNFVKSTYAAAKYLRDRCRNLDNDYLLIVASYNWGVGNVWNAMQRTGKKSPTFWDIKKYLPSETKAYVMNFIALNVVFHNYDKFAKNQLTFKDKSIEVKESNTVADVSKNTRSHNVKK